MKTPPLRLKPALVPIVAGAAAAVVVATLSGPQQDKLPVPLHAPLKPVLTGLSTLPVTPTVPVSPAIADHPHFAAP